MPTITLDAGHDTEALLHEITTNIDDQTLDQIDVSRIPAESLALATEPLTLAATLTMSTALIPVVARLIERWLENRNQLEHLKIIAEGFRQSDSAGMALADVSKAHAKVSIEYRPMSISSKGR